MGEMADYLLNGDDCSWCGKYLGKGDGYPRICSTCIYQDKMEKLNKIKKEISLKEKIKSNK